MATRRLTLLTAPSWVVGVLLATRHPLGNSAPFLSVSVIAFWTLFGNWRPPGPVGANTDIPYLVGHLALSVLLIPSQRRRRAKISGATLAREAASKRGCTRYRDGTHD